MQLICLVFFIRLNRILIFFFRVFFLQSSPITKSEYNRNHFFQRDHLSSLVDIMKKVITAKNAPAAVGPYSHAVKVGNSMYLSGQIPINPENGEIPDGIEAQTRQVFKNISAVLEAGEMNFGDVVICEVFLKDMGDFGEMNKVYAEIFDPYCKDTGYPARAAVAVKQFPKIAWLKLKLRQ